jgi:fatty acid desaturase
MMATVSANDADDSAQDNQRFLVREAHEIVSDLFEPSPLIYWTDFLLTITAAWMCFRLLRVLPNFSAGQVAAYCGAVLLFYRAGSFIHELIHLRSGTFRAFHVVWNLLCGIPLLMPSFMYTTHIAHHARNHYATKEDGEYLPLASGSIWGVLLYLLQAPLIAPLAVVRFLVLTPLAWLSPALRRFLQQRASSLVMDPSYVRPLPSNRELFAWRLQETACWLFATVAATLFITGVNPWSLLLKVYLLSCGVLFINELRTLGAHRFMFDGQRPVSFTDQLRDSVNYPFHPLTTLLWAPVGLRYHALHHLFPSMPYHRLHEAHCRLMAELPADSLYRETVSPSLWATMADLVRTIRERRSARQTAASSAPHFTANTSAGQAAPQTAAEHSTAHASQAAHQNQAMQPNQAVQP